MAPVFIFADQVRKIVKSGSKEIEIPAGARISPAAADLIKEHRIAIKTSPPAAAPAAEISATDDRPAAPDRKKADLDETEPAIRTAENPPAAKPAELDGEELEEIVTRVIERLEQLHGRHDCESESDEPTGSPAASGAQADGDELVICRCEEITRGEIKAAIRNGFHTLNGVKRITRAGMGLCQGQTCQRLVAQILSEELGIGMAEIEPTTARGPVRPLSLSVFANS